MRLLRLFPTRCLLLLLSLAVPAATAIAGTCVDPRTGQVIDLGHGDPRDDPRCYRDQGASSGGSGMGTAATVGSMLGNSVGGALMGIGGAMILKGIFGGGAKPPEEDPAVVAERRRQAELARRREHEERCRQMAAQKKSFAEDQAQLLGQIHGSGSDGGLRLKPLGDAAPKTEAAAPKFDCLNKPLPPTHPLQEAYECQWEEMQAQYEANQKEWNARCPQGSGLALRPKDLGPRGGEEAPPAEDAPAPSASAELRMKDLNAPRPQPRDLDLGQKEAKVLDCLARGFYKEGDAMGADGQAAVRDMRRWTRTVGGRLTGDPSGKADTIEIDGPHYDVQKKDGPSEAVLTADAKVLWRQDTGHVTLSFTHRYSDGADASDSDSVIVFDRNGRVVQSDEAGDACLGDGFRRDGAEPLPAPPPNR